MPGSRGCLTCLQRHLKCDRDSPECQRCQTSGRRCIPAPVGRAFSKAFRHGQNPSLRGEERSKFGGNSLKFPSDQTWLPTSSHSPFLPFLPQPPDWFGGTPCRFSVELQLNSRKPVSFQDESAPTAAMYHVDISDNGSCSAKLDLRGLQHGKTPSESPIPDPKLTASTRTKVPKLEDYREATLLRYFKRVLGPWLDGSDHGGHFAVSVVELATSCQLLLYACLALSARHLSNTSNSMPVELAEDYHERCIAILLPTLTHEDFRTSLDTLLAATVILRLFEQISSQTPLNDSQSHLLAGSVFITSQIDCAISGGLAEASFWAFLIQDVQFALAYQIKMRLPLDALERKLRHRWQDHGQLTEQDWVRKAMFLLAKTVDYCYGHGETSFGVDYDATEDLEREILTWDEECPENFRPLYSLAADLSTGKPFPTLYYTSTEHALGTQYTSLSKALIHQYRQHVNIEDSGSMSSEEAISENLGIVFGIGLSAEDVIPTRIMACHTLCACSSKVCEPLAQRELLGLLRRTELENGWSWSSILQRLSDEWNADRIVD